MPKRYVTKATKPVLPPLEHDAPVVPVTLVGAPPSSAFTQAVIAQIMANSDECCDDHCDRCGECDDCQCCSQCEKHPCECCGTCGSTLDWCDCWPCPSCDEKQTANACSHCECCSLCCECLKCYALPSHSSAYGHPLSSDDYCGSCDGCMDHCGCDSDYDDEYGERANMREKPPWVERGEHVEYIRTDIDFERFKAFSPSKAMAQFYLLSYIEAMAQPHVYTGGNPMVLWDDFDWLREIGILAKQERDALVAIVDPIFRLYLNIAVGGEIRYHRAFTARTPSGGLEEKLLPSDRAAAWSIWLSVYEQVGPQSLVDIAEMFDEWPSHTSVGGEKWAAAARLLHARETNQIPAWMFVDRVFSMQHNSGSVLNKVNWKKLPMEASAYPLHAIKVIGDAHHMDPTATPTLRFYAGGKFIAGGGSVEWFWKEFWTARNRALRALAKPMELYRPLRWYVSLPPRGSVVFNDPTNGHSSVSSTTAFKAEFGWVTTPTPFKLPELMRYMRVGKYVVTEHASPIVYMTGYGYICNLNHCDGTCELERHMTDNLLDLFYQRQNYIKKPAA